jgi:pyruvate dehydrogenase E1 component
VPRNYITLGTDGFGRSDTRAGLRRFFEVDHTGIAMAAIGALADAGVVSKSITPTFMDRYSYRPVSSPPWYDRRMKRPAAKPRSNTGLRVESL